MQCQYTPASILGVPGNFLSRSIGAAGADPAKLKPIGAIDLGGGLKPGSKAWKDTWAAGQGGGAASATQRQYRPFFCLFWRISSGPLASL